VVTRTEHIIVSCGGVRLSPLGRSATIWPIVPAPNNDDDDDECGAVGGMRIGRGNQSNRRKPAPMPLIPHEPMIEPGPPR
jgi:hypothetical protein